MAVRQVPISEQTKDGRKWIYEVRVDKKRYKSKKFLTKKEAQEAEINFYNEKNKLDDQSLMTLGDLFREHFEFQKDKIKSTTLYNYQTRLNYFQMLMDIKLDRLNILDIEKWKKQINTRNLSTGTKNDLLKYLKSTLNYGSKWLDYNFSSLYSKITNFANPDDVHKEMDFYTYDEFKQFISVESDLKFKTLFEVLYYNGLRRGELRGLQWKHIDFIRKEINIIQNIINISGDGGRWKITSPKTNSSIRRIPMCKTVIDDLKALRNESMKYYGFSEDWFVFGDVNPIHYEAIRIRKNKIAQLAGVKQIRLHDFRHSCASLLISQGANVTMVSKYLGHGKVDVTLNVYSHMFRNQLDDIVNTFDALDSTVN